LTRTLHVETWGEVDAPRVVCLHGVTGRGAGWHRLATGWLGEYHVLAPDLIGHGASPYEPPWSIGEHLDTIVATNQAAGSPDCAGPVTSGGNNLESGTSCGFTALGDVQANPKLAPLRANGGPTRTRALRPGSPALNAGDNGTCEPRDQRGIRRPQGPRCDIGSYERKR